VSDEKPPLWRQISVTVERALPPVPSPYDTWSQVDTLSPKGVDVYRNGQPLVNVSSDPIQDGKLNLSLVFPVSQAAETIEVTFTAEKAPPEPTAIDRLAALEDRESAWRCAEWDKWIEEHPNYDGGPTWVSQ
jgi:hypothetical protein